MVDYPPRFLPSKLPWLTPLGKRVMVPLKYLFLEDRSRLHSGRDVDCEGEKFVFFPVFKIPYRIFQLANSIVYWLLVAYKEFDANPMYGAPLVQHVGGHLKGPQWLQLDRSISSFYNHLRKEILPRVLASRAMPKDKNNIGRILPADFPQEYMAAMDVVGSLSFPLEPADQASATNDAPSPIPSSMTITNDAPSSAPSSMTITNDAPSSASSSMAITNDAPSSAPPSVTITSEEECGEEDEDQQQGEEDDDDEEDQQQEEEEEEEQQQEEEEDISLSSTDVDERASTRVRRTAHRRKVCKKNRRRRRASPHVTEDGDEEEENDKGSPPPAKRPAVYYQLISLLQHAPQDGLPFARDVLTSMFQDVPQDAWRFASRDGVSRDTSYNELSGRLALAALGNDRQLREMKSKRSTDPSSKMKIVRGISRLTKQGVDKSVMKWEDSGM